MKVRHIPPAQGFWNNRDLRLILFGGKGGVGKTTVAAATAVHLARARPDSKLLLVSTDPAHSLSDSLGFPLGKEARRLPGVPNLWALEMNAPKLLVEFKARYGSALKTLAERGTYLESRDIEEMLALPLPGAEEVMAIFEIADCLRTLDFDLVLVDTAPTGHTLRLLTLPTAMTRWLGVMEAMQEKHRYLMRRLTGRCRPDETDAFLKVTADRVKTARQVLRAEDLTEFVIVTNPEPLVVSETGRLLAALRRERVAVRTVVVNRLIDSRDCSLCRARQDLQGQPLQHIRERFSTCQLLEAPLSPSPVQGLAALGDLAEALFKERGSVAPPAPLGSTPEPTFLAPDLTGRLGELDTTDLDLLLFGGKGGVGKTTLAAAAAVILAELDPHRELLLLSIDPAHSLSDVLGFSVGARPTPVPSTANLLAAEIDPCHLLEEIKARFSAGLKGLFRGPQAANLRLPFDEEIMARLLELTPPGLDEIMALVEIVGLQDAEPDRNRLIAVDTAPTGHLLSFLRMPEVGEQWLRYALKMINRYPQMDPEGGLFERVLGLRKGVRRICSLLTHPGKCALVAVTIPEAMSVCELGRLLAAVREMQIPCRDVVFNLVCPKSSCEFCSASSRSQQEQLTAFREKWGEAYRVTTVPVLAGDLRGVETLSRLGGVLMGSPRKGGPVGFAATGVSRKDDHQDGTRQTGPERIRSVRGAQWRA